MARHTMRKVPIEDLTKPKGGMCNVYVDYWWFVSDNEEIYFFGTDQSPYSSPQCNQNKMVCDLRKEQGYDKEKYPDVRMEGMSEVRQIPIVFIPVNISDYQY